jgi:hypothetical protein
MIFPLISDNPNIDFFVQRINLSLFRNINSNSIGRNFIIVSEKRPFKLFLPNDQVYIFKLNKIIYVGTITFFATVRNSEFCLSLSQIYSPSIFVLEFWE